MEAPDFWDDAEKASAMKKIKDLKSIVERADALSMAYDDIMTLIEDRGMKRQIVTGSGS